MRVAKYLCVLSCLIILSCSSQRITFQSDWENIPDRVWIGQDYWANPLQDWCIHDGRLECNLSGGDRNLFLLTHRIADQPGNMVMRVTCGQIMESGETSGQGWVGFKIGVRGQFHDYRDDAVRGEGIPIGVTIDKRLFIAEIDESEVPVNISLDEISLELKARHNSGKYKLMLALYDGSGVKIAEISRDDVDPDWLNGGVSLVCSSMPPPEIPNIKALRYLLREFKKDTQRKGDVRFWFSHWEVSGIKNYSERAFGPILFTQYTLSKKTLKLTAQLAPVSKQDGKNIKLQIKRKSIWETVAESDMDLLSRTAAFRVKQWSGEIDVPYRVVCEIQSADGKKKAYFYEGLIRKEPWDKEEIAVAGFTGNNDLGFPNQDIVENVKMQDPDVLFFSGDQIYENVAGYGVQREPLDKACLDYLRKWYLYGWEYGDILKDRPAVAIPDDHDVYHGNIWGAGGKATPKGLTGSKAQDAGGYKMNPVWVNMVQRTQTSHLPDPYDPAPVEQNIGVYYCDLNYAGISFAILEDRKFKSAPKALLPEARIFNGWPQNLKFDVRRKADAEEAKLLGDRQLAFLEDWMSDWRGKVWMKVVLSQTIFSNVATLPVNSLSDAVVPKLRILKESEYPPDDVPVNDFDSNGWPQTGRNKALRILRKGFAFHLAGDQHLGSFIQYGIDAWHDAGFAFCVPAISNVWPRRWCPSTPGQNRDPDSPPYTGDFEDGFGNKMTVYAVSNPVVTGSEPSRLHDRATGYGMVRFNRSTRDITVECWPRHFKQRDLGPKQYPGWPVTINQVDNYGRQPVGYLPALLVSGIKNPVILVTNEKTGELEYALRMKSSEWTPMIFSMDAYTIKVGDPDKDIWKILTHLQPKLKKLQEIVHIEF